MTPLYEADEALPLVLCLHRHIRLSEWHHAALKQACLGGGLLGLWSLTNKKEKKRAGVKTKCLHCTREGSPSHIPTQTLCQSGPDSLFQFSLRRRVVYPPSHLRCLGYDQTGSAVVSVCQHRLTFLPHEVSICCTWQAAGSAQFARLVKPDTDKKRLGEKLTHRGKSMAPANIWWCDFR